jgi:2-dehydro-3-deoxygluconokinase
MKKGKIVTFGELLLRFSKPDHMRLTQGDTFTSKYGGSEANVAVSLATLGDEVEYITRLPDTPVGHAGAMCLAQLGVDVSRVLYGGQRIGTYYFETSAGMRNSKVIYDRTGSSYSDLKPGMIPWREILKDASVFQASGITAAISQNAADATFEALDIADEMGITISYDINYRKNLWNYGADARETLSRMLERCDVMFGDVIEFEFITQRKAPLFDALDDTFEIDPEPYRLWFDEIHRRFPRCRKWLMGMRNQISSSHHTLTALLWSDGRLLSTRVIDAPGLVDPMGVGDAFLAAFLHALQAYPDNEQLQLDYSLAAAVLKNSIPGDFNLSTDDEIMDLVEHRRNEHTLYKVTI